MVRRFFGGVVAGLLLATGATASVTPQAQVSGETVLIPFDPPLDQNLRYRWEQTEQKEGRTEISWSIDSYRFEEADDGYRLIVEPVSYGSNEDDPLKLELARKLQELSKLPFVLRLNEDAEIVGLEGEDEYWSKIIGALREVLSTIEPKRAEHDKVIESIVGLYADMPAETRLAKLTEPVQPLVEFAWAETSIGVPIMGTVETMSPFGPVKQEFTITLTKVSDGLASLTIRSTIPKQEMKKMTAALFDRLNNGALQPEQIAKMKSELAAAEHFNATTVAEYEISTEDGMLETFHSTQTITVSEDDKPQRKVKTLSVKRVD
jgi:hypothetical protein